jgi:hypothetical protein
MSVRKGISLDYDAIVESDTYKLIENGIEESNNVAGTSGESRLNLINDSTHGPLFVNNKISFECTINMGKIHSLLILHAFFYTFI